MKATLIKEKEGVYSLLDGNRFISTTECKDDTPNKLSIKNCEAIERGYDLDELSTSRLATRFDENSGYHKFVFVEAYKEGFQKALEILGDKKFSELDMRIAYDAGCNNIDADDNIDFQDTINSLQPTEFDVEIVMGTQCRQIDCVDRGELVKSKIVKDGETPMLDKDGCLILKRL